MTAAPPARIGSVFVLSLLALPVGGCGGQGTQPTAEPSVSTVSSAATASSAPVACKQPSPPDLPDAAGQVTDADSGAFCLNTSQQIDAFLTAPGGTAAVTDHWVQIKSSDPQVLAYGDNSVLTTPVSVTAGVFVARKAGTAVLTSTLSSGKTWSVTIVVP